MQDLNIRGSSVTKRTLGGTEFPPSYSSTDRRLLSNYLHASGGGELTPYLGNSRSGEILSLWAGTDLSAQNSLFWDELLALCKLSAIS